MTDLDTNRFAPPLAQVAEPAALADAPVLAGRGTRLVAVIIDGLLNMLMFMPIYLLMGGSSFWLIAQQNPADPFAMLGAMLRASALGYVVIIAVQCWSLHAFNGTLGKKLLGLRIVRSDGSRAGFVRLFFGRGAAAVLPCMIPLLGAIYALLDMLLIFRESRQCLHDQIADTIVINAAASARPVGAAIRA